MIVKRETTTGSNDLNVVYRPCKVDEMVGNETSKRILKNALDSKKVPHTQLFTGRAGTGKTTAARIVALGLNCKQNGVSSDPCLECSVCKSILEGGSLDIKEINVGQSGGKDAVDSIVKDLTFAPFNARYKVVIFDEAHKLTPAAKDLLLKPTENGFEHVYIIFCTNHPEELKTKDDKKNKNKGEPFLERCSILNFDTVEDYEIRSLLQNVCEFEGMNYDTAILDIITDKAEGVPRKALVWLNKIALEGSWEVKVAKEICHVDIDEDDPQMFELCKTLNKGSFKESIVLFDKIKNPSVEGLRIMASGYFVTCLKRSKTVQDAKKFSAILDVLLESPIYEQGKLAANKWYNIMFKVTNIIISNRRSK